MPLHFLASSLWALLLFHPIVSAMQHPLSSEIQHPILSETKHLNISASAAANATSILQCWKLAAPFFVSTQSGTVGSMVLQLGNLEKASYSIIPAGINNGYHTAPTPQYVHLPRYLSLLILPDMWSYSPAQRRLPSQKETRRQ